MNEFLLSLGMLILGAVSSWVYQRYGKRYFLLFSVVSALPIGLMPGLGLLGPMFFHDLSVWTKLLVVMICGGSGAACLSLPVYMTSTWAKSLGPHALSMPVLGIVVGSALASVAVIVIHFGLTFQVF